MVPVCSACQTLDPVLVAHGPKINVNGLFQKLMAERGAHILRWMAQPGA